MRWASEMADWLMPTVVPEPLPIAPNSGLERELSKFSARA